MYKNWSDTTQRDFDSLFDRLVTSVKESERPDMDSKGYLEGVRMSFKYQIKEIVEREADET